MPPEWPASKRSSAHTRTSPPLKSDYPAEELWLIDAHSLIINITCEYWVEEPEVTCIDAHDIFDPPGDFQGDGRTLTAASSLVLSTQIAIAVPEAPELAGFGLGGLILAFMRRGSPGVRG